MPKIIKDVEKTIRNCAMQLFIEFSYNNVDMRMISKNSKISVGTIYNYYKNKKQLYLSILEESWENTFNKLDSINSLTISSTEKVNKFIETLYEDIEARNGLGKTLINDSSNDLKADKLFINLKNNLLLRVTIFLNSFNKVDSLNDCCNINIRLAESLLSSVLIMLDSHPNEKKDNINFLIQLINLSIK
ncbi:TetR/AcrR family transcriptional regulator [Clostridium aestuarii]|uniref:TetR/AcrR family transcriptional regulator n=1 Tax=Clostridium aestuarii TaxID=338193 RepID=A0ABT4CYZ4_9CLOT|nr:TetR/AcrR family transcriptional regulator [Clostridium aestuarii]MCY6484196.1 TetR/AcrR family transcriptional regulator [Clostridium aestuarii]